MHNLTITFIQTELFWKDISANLKMLDEKIEAINNPTDLILLPEMFSTGFSMNAGNLAETMQGESPTWMRAASKKHDTDLVGSIMIRENNRFYNRLFWAKPNGELLVYDKRHLFRMTGEHDVYTPGRQNVLVELKGWKIRPFVCYDLRFPAWTRNTGNGYDLSLYIANWPAARSNHWKLLLRARAIENQAYVVGVNRIGTDGNGLAYSGDSAVIEPNGNILMEEPDRPGIISARLRKNELDTYRESFPAWMDADPELEKLFPPS